MTAECEHCMFFRSNYHDSTCRKHAPIAPLRVILGNPYADDFLGIWPKVNPQDGCGDFKEAQGHDLEIKGNQP